GWRRPLDEVPRDVTGLDVDRADRLRERLARRRPRRPTHEALPRLPLHLPGREQVAALERLEVIKPGGGIERRREPVGAALEPWTDVGVAARVGLQIVEDRPALRIQPRRPG